ncbi:MAG: hypothetical protein MRK02_04535 [Candidatus Scalindua sp.]|nr:hypothetical protein [Candidatus Scalindua sp.]
MRSSIAYIRPLTSIDSLKEYIRDDKFDYAILEKIDEIVFEKFSDKFTLDEWNKGRLFGEKAELKWVKRNGTYHVVLITDGEVPCGYDFIPFGKLQPLKENPFREIFLWGKKDMSVEGWYDPRIPKILKYPVDDFKTAPHRLKILVKSYELFRNGVLTKEPFSSEIYRYVGLRGE